MISFSLGSGRTSMTMRMYADRKSLPLERHRDAEAASKITRKIAPNAKPARHAGPDRPVIQSKASSTPISASA
jgi:hypothetical protein